MPRCVAAPFLISCGAEHLSLSFKSAVSLSTTGLPGGHCLAAQVKEFRPVTEVVLRNPLPATG